jgi:hypothetical protein
VQSVSTATCERAFSVQNLIKTKVRNRLGSKNLGAMLRIALEGPYEEVDDIIGEAIPLWKLYANPSSYVQLLLRILFRQKKKWRVNAHIIFYS